MPEWFSTETPTRRTSSMLAGLLGALLIAGICAPISASAAPAGCAALQAKYPAWKGKTLVNAINPHTPGYEAIDPKDPDKYVGFDIDLGEQIGECLGFKLTYKAVTFAALLTTLSSGQADIVISDIYATEERAKAADFENHRHQHIAVWCGGSREHRLRRSSVGAGPRSEVQSRGQARANHPALRQ
jgi:polar amino acid transport system substrate-binding protein